MMNQSHNNVQQQGFTIVELIITIVVIAILATVVTIAYGGVTTRAIETSMQSDLKNSESALNLDLLKTGAYPASAALANRGQGLQASGDNTLVYTVKPYGFCVEVSNPKTTKVFSLRSFSDTNQEGGCAVNVSTLAGNGAGYADGNGDQGLVDSPNGIAIDDHGIIYVADRGNNRIRKLTPSGQLTTIAGSGTAGSNDGTGSAAQFDDPVSLALDSSGNIFVVDRGNNAIRKVTQEGVVTTFAGGHSGYTDAQGTAAEFDWPQSIVIDSSDNMYISDSRNDVIRKVTPSGLVSTFAGGVWNWGYLDGQGTAAQFNWPENLAIDKNNNLYLADANNNMIRKITPSGLVSTLAGTGTAGSLDGSVSVAQFNSPQGVDVDKFGNVYVADGYNYKIRIISSQGVVSTLVGNGDHSFADGDAATARLGWIEDIKVNKDGTVYLADGSNHRIRAILQ